MSLDPRFVHLRIHTEYSVVDGTLRVDAAVSRAAEDGQGALAITDIGNLFAAVKFYTAARKRGVKPILGADVWVQAPGEVAPSRIVLLVQSPAGYLNLCELISEAWLRADNRVPAVVPWEVLRAHTGDLIALSGAEHGSIGQALLAGDTARASAAASRFAEMFAGRFYLEVQRAGLPGHETLVRRTARLAHDLRLPLVATHPVQFDTPDDFEAHEARICVADGEMLTNPKRVKRFGREQHFKTQAQMEVLFADLPSALANTVVIAQRCNLMLTLGKPQLPAFPTPLRPDGTPTPIEDYFREQSLVGLDERMVQLYPDAKAREAELPRYRARLEFEITTILKMGFPGYFLIVADFINWAKTHGCPVGPGRGSGAGSLVAYSLKITDLDPLRYKLLFERFLNPDRVSMPDFDIDFCQGNRDRVIDYVKLKYGRDAVSQIATFGTMAAKAALRDVGRVLGMGYGQVDSVAKLVPAPPGKTVTLARPGDHPDPGLIYARREAPEIEERERKEEEVAELLALAERCEGLVRNVGMHAGGVLIAPGKITDFCPLYLQPGSDSAVSQFDKDDVESIGLVKFDFLGLATLTILELARQFISDRRPKHRDFNYEALPLDDRRTYELMSEGRTVAVFQLESPGMQRMLRDAKPSLFEDVIALVALYRPGPMDLIPSFCARKHGKEEVDYPHPLMREVLEETYGIMVYQEQVMQVAQRLGGYSLGAADLLRRAMGKKKAEEMAQQRAIFSKGAAANNIGEAQADEIFDLMEKFAGYGFNKSHAAAYALLAYHTAYLKVHFLAEFTAANMSVSIDDTDKLKIFHDDAVALGITFETPNVNTGTYRFEPVADQRVRYGLGAVKGTGQHAIDSIVAARSAGGPFASLFDFCSRVDRTRVNKRTVEALIKAGAFDSLDPAGQLMRPRWLASIGLAFDHADTQAANALQGGLFDFGDEPGAAGSSTEIPPLIEVAPWGVRERLSFEKAALGLALSGHLFDEHREEVRRFCKQSLEDLLDSREPQLLAGIVSDLRLTSNARGRVALFKLDDGSEAIDAVVGEELLDASRDRLKDDALIIVQAKVQQDRFAGGLRLNVMQVLDLPAARCRYGRYLRVPVNGHTLAVDDLLQAFPARKIETDEGSLTQGLPVRLVVQRSTASGELDLGDESRFFPSDEALTRWRSAAQDPSLGIVYG